MGGLLTSSFAAFGRSGHVTHAMMWSLDSVIGTLLIFVDKSKTFHRQIQKFCRQIQKILSTNPKNFVDKSKKFRRQIQKNSGNKSKEFRRQIQKILSTNPKISLTNPKNFVDKSKKFSTN